MSNFVMQFRLKTEKFQEDIINKRFEISRKIYNSLVNVTQKRYKEMVKTKEYRNTIQELKITSEKNKKPLYLKLQELRTKFGIYEFAFFFDVKKMQQRAVMLEYHKDHRYKKLDDKVKKLIDELNSIPLYQEYTRRLNDLNDMISYVTYNIEEYINSYY